jgi:Mlc titration factor MtfA (ptsG expression regulator)
MNTLLIVILILAILMLAFVGLLKPRRKVVMESIPLPGNYRQLLNDHVQFYRKLDEAGKNRFEIRLQHFLAGIRITGVRTNVEDIDRVLIGASAIIPIFAFAEWEYINLNEVLLYPETFSEEFKQEGGDRYVTGMVGSGPMQYVMVLSQHALRQGFLNNTDKSNTAIHEFVHLIDKTDGDADGVPEILMHHQYTLPWLDMIHKNIKEVMRNKSDINPYGATNQTEFFAVVSEYFFERPDLLQIKHPELYEMIRKIYGVKL